MNTEHVDAILTIALFAAFADGVKDEREREAVRGIADSLSGENGAPDLARRYQDVLLKRVTLAGVAGSLTADEHRHLAYEMAVCVCDADGRQSDAERRFLAELQGLLGLAAGEASSLAREADAVTEAWGEPVMAAAAVGVAAADRSRCSQISWTMSPNSVPPGSSAIGEAAYHGAGRSGPAATEVSGSSMPPEPGSATGASTTVGTSW